MPHCPLDVSAMKGQATESNGQRQAITIQRCGWKESQKAVAWKGTWNFKTKASQGLADGILRILRHVFFSGSGTILYDSGDILFDPKNNGYTSRACKIVFSAFLPRDAGIIT